MSVYDKKGLPALAGALVELGWEIVSSGGTSKVLREHGVVCTQIESVTGAPEMLDGRVKTLHPAIHGGILADLSQASHLAALQAQGIQPFDLVVCNLYPFASQPSIEMIDVGGPTMVRAAAKNHAHVGVVVDPADYDQVLREIRSEKRLSETTRLRLARAAFKHTAAYDAAIVDWFNATTLSAGDSNSGLPSAVNLTLEKAENLRYGENPHQKGARYIEAGQSGWWDSVQQHSGMALSFLNIFDADAAWRLVNDLGPGAAAAIIKHANPCGAAVDSDIASAYRRAFECDPISAFGGIVALNRTVSSKLAEEMVANPKADVIIAPGYEPEALELFATKKKNLRVLEAQVPGPRRFELRRIDGGFLMQGADMLNLDRNTWRVVTKTQPTDEQWADLELAWKVCAAVSSNAIVVVNNGQAVGIGAGQSSRLDSAAIAVDKAADQAKGGACASDAFFPFRDGLDAVALAGVSCVIQPGESVRDDEVIAAADEHGIAMVFTGERHFKH